MKALMDQTDKLLRESQQELNLVDIKQRKIWPTKVLQQVLLTLLVMVLMCCGVYLFNIPNPNMILITGLTVCTALYGFPAGITSGIIMIIYSMFFFSTDHSFFSYTSINLQKLAVIIFGVVVDVVFIGRLKDRQMKAQGKLSEIIRWLRQTNISLEEASLQDALTGISNRRALTKRYPGYEGQNLHVMMIDLDNFKQVNDVYGHAVGDYVLKHLGKALREIYGTDNSYRYGGDEFLVISSDIDEKEFAEKTQLLRNRIERIHPEKNMDEVSFSAGYVYGDCELSSDLRLMMHQADALLYEAKKKGKNQFGSDQYSRQYARSLQDSLGGDKRFID